MVGEKGQVTIPKRLRDDLGIEPGTTLEFAEESGRIVMRKAPGGGIRSLLGILPQTDVDALLSAMRGPAWSEEMDEGHRDKRR